MIRPDVAVDHPKSRFWRWALLGLVGAALLIAAALWLAMARLGVTAQQAWDELAQRPPMELVRHLQRRLEGHPRLEAILNPGLNHLRQSLEREPPPGLMDLGKGQRDTGLSPALFSVGVPVPASPLPVALRSDASPSATERRLANTTALAEAMAAAKAGDVLELLPGSYRIGQQLDTGHGGRADAPIVVRAVIPGTVELLVDTVQAIVVSRPYWLFENLTLRGVCVDHGACEHAFHIVGDAKGTVVRNNLLRDFNAHIKVNGEGGRWPDHGLLQFNTFTNSGPRQTDKPVTLVDIVGVNGWQLLDNRIENFVKAGGNQTSFGAFLKGAGRQGRMERNLVVCTPQGVAQPGLRVGLSIGGGGTGTAFCRDGACRAEHFDALVANNIVAHCNDAGIDVYRSQGTVLSFNTLVNTAGVLVRGDDSQARVQANVIEGRLRAAKGGRIEESDNLVRRRLDGTFSAADSLDLRWLDVPPIVAVSGGPRNDMCNRPRPSASPPGALMAGACSTPRQRP
ncbi:MAG: hypothetical protein Q8K45_02205 [Rubrivivax sp.]|nr:hypothetical protein [Rubrivivax sp.]